MRQLEALLGAASGLLALGTALLALAWVAVGVPRALLAPDAETVQPAATETVAKTETAPAEATAPAPAEPAATQPAAEQPVQTAASGSAAADGEKVFKKCKACHTVDQGGKNGTGPNLWSVVGRQVASVEGFKYSDAMVAFADGKAWTEETLGAFLEKPKGVVDGTKMSFAGLAKADDRASVIAYLMQNSDNPPAVEASAPAAAPAAATAGDATAEVVLEDIPYPDGVTYANPPARTPEEQAKVDAAVAALKAELPLDYERARFHRLHFPPAIQQASNEECLVCHQEILDHEPRSASPAGVPADATMAWYQTLDTYEGPQMSFHARHLTSPFAQEVMNLQCVFCHQGNDPREESPDMIPTRAAFSAPEVPEFTLRKMVNPSETCLRCHGAMPDPEGIMGLGGPWHEVRADIEYPEAPNGCLSCHAETFRTVRHAVDYLKAASIEERARSGSGDACYGCHGGRSWYRISYPYPRHNWPGMDETVPEWAAGRPTESDPAHALPADPAN